LTGSAAAQMMPQEAGRPVSRITRFGLAEAMMDIGLIFSAADAAKSVAAMLGVIDSLEAKVDRLVRSELNAGFRNLDQACVAEGERDSLLREARGCFNKAVSLEGGFRQGLALLGCAVCSHHLRDAANCRRCLDELVQLPPAVGVAATAAAHSVDMAKDSKGFRFGVFVVFYKAARRLFVVSERVAHRKKMVMDAVGWSSEAKSLLQLQQAVSLYTGSPVAWLAKLEAGQF
jgi:hypothetical protein